MPGAAMTTIEALNATGVVYAVQDGPAHVSVRPVVATYILLRMTMQASVRRKPKTE